MVRKKVDNRIRVLIENGVRTKHRTMFVVVGDKARDQIVILHHMLSKADVRARPSVLWCYKKDLGFSSHRKKRMKQLQKKIQSGKVDVNEDDPFELFIASTNIRYCYYSETHKILGNTYGMLILQDFEAITPNLLARTIETIEGGGVIVFLMNTINSLKQLYTLSMDVHSRFRTESHQNVVGRFNERFILSLGSCENCIVMSDSLDIIPISSAVADIKPVSQSNSENDSETEEELMQLKKSLEDTQPIGVLINCCKTLDQAKAVLKFIDAISEKKLSCTVSLTAARGRGKSAALGLSIAAAIAFGYSNIYVTSPSPENLNTLFQFVIKGLEVLHYLEHMDYEIVRSTSEEHLKAIIRINMYRDHRQTIQYISPNENQKLGQAELVVIDEAAAIPLPLVQSLFGPHLMFLASTINGYEGTGRSLSLKLLKQLRAYGTIGFSGSNPGAKPAGRTLCELKLEESIRYKSGDAIEKWLSALLCLDATLTPSLSGGCPPPKDCELFYINRDTLFSFHKASEIFLHRIMSLYVASHYKNTPNDLQLMSDAPAHHLFCLTGPVSDESVKLPEVLCVIQVCLEGEISKASISTGLKQGKRAAGDLIPWTIAQQFQDQNFPSLNGVRIVRIATHPEYSGMGYGSRAMELLVKYFEGNLIDISENDANTTYNIPENRDEDSCSELLVARSNLPPLLSKLTERPYEGIHYIGVSYGLTLSLLKFWKRAGFVPVYLRQTANDLTGEHTCIMLKVLSNSITSILDLKWIDEFYVDFCRRFISLLSFQFSKFTPNLALSILQNRNVSKNESEDILASELLANITPHDLKRLELYTKNMADYHLIMDLIPTLSRLFFLGKLGDVKMSAAQSAVMLGLGLQHKTVDILARDLDVAATQLLGLFNRTMRKMLEYMNRVLEKNIDSQLSSGKTMQMLPLAENLNEELEKGAKEVQEKMKEQKEKLSQQLDSDLNMYSIKGSEESWKAATESGFSSSVSVKIGAKRPIVMPSKVSKLQKTSADEFGKGWKKKNNKKKLKS